MNNPTKINGVRTEAVGDGLAVHDVQSGQTYFLNATTALVWDHCDGKNTTQQLIGLLQFKFNLSVENAEALLMASMTELGKARLLQTDGAVQASAPKRAELARRSFFKTVVAVSAALLPLVVNLRETQAIGTTSATTTLPPTGNDAPLVAADEHLVSVSEGDTAVNTGTISDPNGDVVSLSASAGSITNNGDGTWAWSLAATVVPDSQTVVITADDGQGGVTQTNFLLEVINAAPAITSVTGPTSPVALGGDVALTATFTDPGANSSHTCTFDWGDGSSSLGAVTEAGGAGSATATHTYAAAGVYSVTVTVTDEYGAIGIATYANVVAYDPNAAKVTGGGQLNSPSGAYPADPSLTGKVNFGLNAKYQGGSSLPTGVTTFQFHPGGIMFQSSSYSWLVSSGGRAQYAGVGTINGGGSYNFLVTADDGSVDKLRMQIWSAATGDVIYDNVPGAPDDISSANPQPISKGSIVVHV